MTTAQRQDEPRGTEERRKQPSERFKDRTIPEEQVSDQFYDQNWGRELGYDVTHDRAQDWPEPDSSQMTRAANMIAFRVPAELSAQLVSDIEGAEQPENLHVTLCTFDHPPNDDTDLDEVVAAVDEVCRAYGPVTLRLTGMGQFESSDGVYPTFATISGNGLAALRTDIVRALLERDVPVRENYDFTPHLTLAYLPDQGPFQNPPSGEWTADSVNVEFDGFDPIAVALPGDPRTAQSWWTEMSPQEQKQYIQEHPHTKMKPTTKPKPRDPSLTERLFKSPTQLHEINPEKYEKPKQSKEPGYFKKVWKAVLKGAGFDGVKDFYDKLNDTDKKTMLKEMTEGMLEEPNAGEHTDALNSLLMRVDQTVVGPDPKKNKAALDSLFSEFEKIHAAMNPPAQVPSAEPAPTAKVGQDVMPDDIMGDGESGDEDDGPEFEVGDTVTLNETMLGLREGDEGEIVGVQGYMLGVVFQSHPQTAIYLDSDLLTKEEKQDEGGLGALMGRKQAQYKVEPE